RSGDGAAALRNLREASQYLEKSGEPSYLYNGACALSLASSVSDPAEGSAASDRRLRDAERAVALLTSAFEHGFSNPAYLEQDSDLAPIRSRDDFRALVRRMEAKVKANAPKPGNPAKP